MKLADVRNNLEHIPERHKMTWRAVVVARGCRNNSENQGMKTNKTTAATWLWKLPGDVTHDNDECGNRVAHG